MDSLLRKRRAALGHSAASARFRIKPRSVETLRRVAGEANVSPAKCREWCVKFFLKEIVIAVVAPCAHHAPGRIIVPGNGGNGVKKMAGPARDRAVPVARRAGESPKPRGRACEGVHVS
jgi:hypothetical protein